MLFGEQQNFTDAEQELFWKIINAKSIKTGIHILDLFELLENIKEERLIAVDLVTIPLEE